MSDLQTVLSEVLEAAIGLAEADFGNIQIIDPEGNLRIVVHSGFPDWWIDYWSRVSPENGSCGLALARGERLIVEDVEQSPIFAGTPGLDTLLKVGIRAIQSTPLRGASGQIVGMFSTHWCTPHTLDAKALKLLDMLAEHVSTLIERERTEESMRRIIHFAPIGIAIGDWDMNIRLCNPAYCKLLGYTEKELLSKHNLAELVFLEDLETDLRVLQRLKAGEISHYQIENRYRRKNGEIIWVRKNVSLLPGTAAGQHSQILLLANDLNAQKQTEQALKQARDLLADAQKIAHLGSFEYVAATGKITWSEEEYRIYGLEPNGVLLTFEEMLSRSIHPEDANLFQRKFASAVKKQKTYKLEHRIIRPDGSIRWIHNLAQPFFDEQKNLLRYVGTTMDITERKREDSEAQKQNELMQSLARQQVAVHTAAAFAHELNQPLVSITAYSEVALAALRSGKEKAEQLAQVIEGSHEQALRAGQVLHKLIDHLHKADTEPSPFYINALVKHVIKKMRKMEFLGIQVKLNLEPDLPRVLGNQLQTEKVLLNLIQNGIEAMKESGMAPLSFDISVRTHADQNMAHVTVRDSGPGLDAANAHQIFSPFFTTKAEGLGLGLAISRSLVEAQGGNLWFDPEDKPGAVFHFTLPFAEPRAAVLGNQDSSGQTSGRNGKRSGSTPGRTLE